MLEITPNAFHRIQVRRVGRQIVDEDCAALGLQVSPHEFGAMCLQTVPDDEQLLADGGLQSFEKFNDLGTLDRAVEQPEVKSPVAQPSDHRELLPAEAVLQHRCLSLRGPGSRATRSLGQTRLVNEDDYSALSRSDFFNSGHLLAFHVRTARSSRSRATPVA